VLGRLDEREVMSGATRLERVLAYTQLGRTRKREVALGQMEADPEQALGRALEHLLRGEDEEAMRVCAEARDELDVHPMWLRLYAVALLRVGRTGELRALLEEMALTPTYDVVRKRLELRIYAKLGHGNPEFVTTHEHLVAFDTTSVGMLVDLATANFWQGRMTEAMTSAQSALERAPRSPEANWIMGLVHRYNGDRGKAKRHLEAAFVTTDDARLLVELGQVYLDLAQYDRAQRSFYRAVLIDRKNLAAVRGLGRSYALGNPTKGKRELNRIINGYAERSKAHRGEILKWLAVMYGSREGSEGAKPYLERAKKELGERSDLLEEFGRYHEAAGRDEQARTAYLEALRRDTTLTRVHVGLARLALAAKKPERATEHLEEYVEFEPYGEHVAWARERLEELDAKKRERDDAQSPSKATDQPR